MAKPKRTQRDGIYTRKDRPGIWISWTDSAGRRRFRKTDARSHKEAQSIRAAELMRVEQARVLGFTPPGDEIFADVSARYLKYQQVRLSAKAYDRTRGVVETLLNPFFTGKLAAIRKTDVQNYITKRSSTVAAGTVIRELGILKHLLNLAVEWELIAISPAQSIRSPKSPAGRVRYLQPTELKLLIEHCPSWLAPIVALAVCTGMRRSEILNLRWLDIDLTLGRILLPQTKNGEGRVVYLNATARAALLSLPTNEDARPTDRVFDGVCADYVTQIFRKVCQSLEIADFKFHDLRHTAASWLRMTGADIHSVATLLGHKDLRMAARYQHLSTEFLADAVGKLDGVFGLREEVRYQDVTEPKALNSSLPATACN